MRINENLELEILFSDEGVATQVWAIRSNGNFHLIFFFSREMNVRVWTTQVVDENLWPAFVRLLD